MYTLYMGDQWILHWSCWNLNYTEKKYNLYARVIYKCFEYYINHAFELQNVISKSSDMKTLLRQSSRFW